MNGEYNIVYMIFCAISNKQTIKSKTRLKNSKIKQKLNKKSKESYAEDMLSCVKRRICGDAAFI